MNNHEEASGADFPTRTEDPLAHMCQAWPLWTHYLIGFKEGRRTKP